MHFVTFVAENELGISNACWVNIMTKTISLDNLDIDALLALREDIDARLTKMAASEMEALEKRMAELAKYASKPVPVSSRSTKKKISKKTTKKRKTKKAPIKFHDPKTGNSWSGRGLTPVWLRDYEANGGKRADLGV